MTNTTKKYTLKGVNDDTDTCEICGRTELKRVMWLMELDEEGEEIGIYPFACGTTCGAKLLKTTVGKMTTKAKNWADYESEQRWRIMIGHESYKKTNALYDELSEVGRKTKANGQSFTFSDRINHPIMKEIERLQAEAEEYANSLEISMPL